MNIICIHNDPDNHKMVTHVRGRKSGPMHRVKELFEPNLCLQSSINRSQKAQVCFYLSGIPGN